MPHFDEAMKSVLDQMHRDMDNKLMEALIGPTNAVQAEDPGPLTVEKLEAMIRSLRAMGVVPVMEFSPLRSLQHWREAAPVMKFEQDIRIRWHLHFPISMMRHSPIINLAPEGYPSKVASRGLHCVGQVGGIGIWSDPTLRDNQIKIVHPDGRLEIVEGDRWIDSF